MTLATTGHSRQNCRFRAIDDYPICLDDLDFCKATDPYCEYRTAVYKDTSSLSMTFFKAYVRCGNKFGCAKSLLRKNQQVDFEVIFSDTALKYRSIPTLPTPHIRPHKDLYNILEHLSASIRKRYIRTPLGRVFRASLSLCSGPVRIQERAEQNREGCFRVCVRVFVSWPVALFACVWSWLG